MANKKISEMTYKQLSADDQFPTINSSTPNANNYAFGGDIPVLLGITQWNPNAVYGVNQIVIYNSNTVSGMFRVKTITSAGDAPEGSAFDKFESQAIGWKENLHVATNIDYFLDIGGQRTGKITYNDSLSVGDSLLIVLTGNWISSANKNLIVTNNSVNSLMSGESFVIEYYNTQINIYCKVTDNYSSGQFKIKFMLHG